MISRILFLLGWLICHPFLYGEEEGVYLPDQSEFCHSAVIAMEQAIGASLEAAVEISAEHAASSASTPEEAERLRQGVYQACEKGFAVAAVFGIGKGIRSVKAGAGAAKMGSVKPHHTRDDVYIPQSKTGSSFSQFDAKASRITKKAHEAEDVGLTLTHNVGSRQAFDRKLTALQDLAERGKLVKVSDVMRDREITKLYRENILTQAQTQWGATDPARVQRIDNQMFIKFFTWFKFATSFHQHVSLYFLPVVSFNIYAFFGSVASVLADTLIIYHTKANLTRSKEPNRCHFRVYPK